MSELIPQLRDLCVTRCGYNIPIIFGEAYVRLHGGNWDRAQEHWEDVVARVLNTDAVEQNASGRRAMKQAVEAAAYLLIGPAYHDRCPLCPQRVGAR